MNSHINILCTRPIEDELADLAASHNIQIHSIPFIKTEPIESVELQQEIENQLEYWNAESPRVRRAIEEAVNPGPFVYEGKIYSVVEEKNKLKELLSTKSDAARKAKKELEAAYSNVAGGIYKPEPIAAKSAEATALSGEPRLELTSSAPAGKAELAAYTEKLNQTNDRFQTVRAEMNEGSYSMTQMKNELNSLKNQKIEVLHFDRKPGSAPSSEEVIYSQRSRTYAETEQKIEHAVVELESKLKTTRNFLAECSEYTAYPVGRGGMIDQKIDYMLFENKNAASALTDLRTKLEKDLKKLSFIREEDHANLFPGVDFQTMRTRIQQNIGEINRRMPK